MDVRTVARERLRDRGLPQTPQYIDAELRRMEIQQDRKMARAGVHGPSRPGGLPRAEAEEVVAETERDASGQFVGRHAGVRMLSHCNRIQHIVINTLGVVGGQRYVCSNS